MSNDVKKHSDVLLEKRAERAKRIQRIGLICGFFCFVSVALELYFREWLCFIYFGMALGLISYLCIFADRKIKQNENKISTKSAVLVSSLSWLTGIAVLAKILPAGQSMQNDKDLLFWFVIYFYAPLSFAINLPAWGLYSRIQQSRNIFYCIGCILLPLTALSFVIYKQYNDIEELISFFLIFVPTIYYVLRFYFQKNETKVVG